MKISAIPAGANAAIAAAAAARTNNNNKIDLPTNNYHPHYGSAEKMTQPKHSTFPNAMQKKRRDSSTNSSFCSACTESDDSDSSLPSAKIQQRSRKVPPTTPKRKPQKNGMPPTTVTVTGKFILIRDCSIPISGTDTNDDASSAASVSDSSDDDSDDSDDDSSESNAVNRTHTSNDDDTGAKQHRTNLGQTRSKCFDTEQDDADGSTSGPPSFPFKPNHNLSYQSVAQTELPALVSAAIQRVAESGSDGEIVQPVHHYTSSLLRDFVAKTQMIGSNMTESPQTVISTPPTQAPDPKNTSEHVEPVKKKRGRPRKIDTSTAASMQTPAATRTSANATKKSKKSPDSGIVTSTPHNQVPNGLHEAQKLAAAAGTGRVGRAPTITKAAMKQQAPMPKKLDIGRLEKCMYATERVLYPPRARPRRQSGVGNSTNETVHATSELLAEETGTDPVWRKIDINKKFRRPSTCGYKSDGGNTICSKVLAAQSGYISDYGNVKTRHLSGYKSDYSCKSRRSGYKSDFSVKAKSCGYRSDCSTRHRRKIRRKRRTKTASSSATFGAAAKATVTDLDILQLAGLSLGQSEESSRDSNSKDEIGPQVRKRGGGGSDLLDSLCERMSQRVGAIDSEVGAGPRSKFNVSTNALNADVYKEIRAKAIKMDGNKPAMIRRRRSSAVSHCSSRCSTISRHPFHRRRRKRLKSRSDLLTEPNAAKINTQIESMVNSFSSQCSIYAEKSSTREKETTSGGGGKGGATKRIVKKRKGATDNDKEASTSVVTSKRRHKKAVQTKSPDDHKLPLKKRHYLLTPGEKSEKSEKSDKGDKSEKSEGKSASAASPPADGDKHKSTEEQAKASGDAGGAGKAVTPKKRHLLETPNEEPRPADANDANATQKESAKDVGTDAKTAAASKRVEAVARKKTRLEGVLSKIQPANATTAAAAPAKETTKTQPKETTKSQPKEAAKAQPKEAAKAQAKETSKAQSAQPTAQPSTREAKSTTVAPVAATATQAKANAAGRIPIVRTTTHEPMVASPPPGVFVSTIDLELQIPFTSISLPSPSKPDMDLARTAADKKALEQQQKRERVVEKLLNRTGGHLLMKRKRKKPNRTGFPTLKKKKKRPATPAKAADETEKAQTPTDEDSIATEESMPIAEAIENTSPDTIKSNTSQSKKVPCDRVPSEGEPTETFIERDSRPRLSVVSLDRLQGKEATEVPAGSKRARDMSEEKSQSNRKRHKNDRLVALEKEKRDHSSDNEPLINFVQKKNASAAKTGAKTTVPERRGRNATEKTIEKAKTPPPAPVTVAPKAEPVPRRRRESICIGKIDSAMRRGDELIEFGTRRGNRRKELSSLSPSPSLENAKKKARPLQQKEVLTTQKTEKNAPKSDNGSSQADLAPKSKVDKNASPTPVEGAKEKSSASAPSTKKFASESSSLTQHRRIETKRPDSDSKNAKKRDDDTAKEKISKTKAKTITADAASKENTENDKKSGKKEKQSGEKPVDSAKAKRGQDKTVGKSDLRSVRKETVTTKNQSPGPGPGKNATLNGPSGEAEAAIDEDVRDAAKVAFDETDYFEHDPLPVEENPEGVDVASTEIVDNRKALSRPRKRYLTAGLFSNYYKENHPSGAKSSTSSAKTDDAPAPIGSLLPPPAYCERYFRRTIIDFCLPWDLWHAHENGKLPGRNIVHSWNFKKIRTNVYCDVRANPSTDLPQCSCKPETNCGDNCLNRLVYTECSPETCPCRESCQNTKIQRHMIAPGVEKFMTQQKGWGVQSKYPIKKGTYILEYVGEVVTEREFKERMATLYTSDIHHYCLHLDGGLVIDGHRMGSDCRFVNHSCAPNCEMQKWSVNGLSRMALFAMRDIEPGEELTYDYNFSLFNPAEGQPCKCESEQCRGVIGGKSQRVRPIESHKVRLIGPSSPTFEINLCFSIQQQQSNEKVLARRSGKSGWPKKGIGSKSKGFMHAKDTSRNTVFQLPSAKEQSLVANGHCFLLRNLRKVWEMGIDGRRGNRHVISVFLLLRRFVCDISRSRMPRRAQMRCKHR